MSDIIKSSILVNGMQYKSKALNTTNPYYISRHYNDNQLEYFYNS